MLLKEFNIVSIILTMRQMKKIIKNDTKMKLKESTHKDEAKRRINLISDDEKNIHEDDPNDENDEFNTERGREGSNVVNTFE